MKSTGPEQIKEVDTKKTKNKTPLPRPLKRYKDYDEMEI